MATIKSYTDLSQSKTLSKILPLESADMCYPRDAFAAHYDKEPVCHYNGIGLACPCWSLAALLSVLPNYQLQTQDDGIGILCSCNGKFNIVTANNSVDACYEMIIRLNELKML